MWSRPVEKAGVRHFWHNLEVRAVACCCYKPVVRASFNTAWRLPPESNSGGPTARNPRGHGHSHNNKGPRSASVPLSLKRSHYKAPEILHKTRPWDSGGNANVVGRNSGRAPLPVILRCCARQMALGKRLLGHGLMVSTRSPAPAQQWRREPKSSGPALTRPPLSDPIEPGGQDPIN